MTDDPLAALLASVQAWATRTFPAPAGGTAGADCEWCPLCQLASVLRGEHPELTDRVTEAGAALVTALRAVFDAAAQHNHTPDGPAATVQRIDLGADPE
jgi:hypothetical protein